MNDKYIRDSLLLFASLFLLTMVFSCANMGTPSGGPYDETPPKMVSSKPVPNTTNYQGKTVEILFDELIQIDKPSENVVITPPQVELPIVRAAGRKAVVELFDSLKPNTTYTIDFTNSISDNNEKNVYENFSFAFSTGDVIDTLQIGGTLLNAENLEPMPGITIGLHENLEDSAFVKLPFLRTSRTNDKGQFTIRNIAPGKYHVFALNDVNRDYKFDQPGEEIAFHDSVFVPSFELSTRQDTIWKDSLTIDTVFTVNYTHFMPDDIELRLFKEKFARQYMLKPERTQENKVTLKFNTALDTIPELVPVNFTPQVDSSWYYVQSGEGGTVINYWLTDSLVWHQDTLRVSVTYPKSDSLNILQAQTDTVTLQMRRRPDKKKKKKGDEKEPIVFLGMNINPQGTVNLYDTISVVFDEPVLGLKKDPFFLQQKVDTLWHPVDFEFFPDTVNSLGFFIRRPWNYGEEYRLDVDSAAIYSLYDKWNDTYSGEFKIKKKDEYGHFYLNIIGVDTTAYVELLDGSDKPVRKSKVKDGGALFMDLKPDKYYVRLVLDTNGNGKWDTGKYSDKRQPEMVYYSPKQYNVMQNWEVEETWDVLSAPFNRQKPLEITKNKPAELTKKKRNYKDEQNQKPIDNNQNNRNGGLGMPF